MSLALLKPAAQQPEAAPGRPEVRGTSLESLLRELTATHRAFFLYRSDLVKGKFVNLDARSFRTWEEKLTYAVTMCDLRVEKTGRNLYVISAPKKVGASLPAPRGEAESVLASRDATASAAIAATVTGQITGPDQAPIPGATVVVKGTTNGTTADESGNFSLTLPDASATLVVSAGRAVAASDAHIMAEATGVPALVWAVLWSVIAIIILVTALRIAYGQPAHRVMDGGPEQAQSTVQRNEQ